MQVKENFYILVIGADQVEDAHLLIRRNFYNR